MRALRFTGTAALTAVGIALVATPAAHAQIGGFGNGTGFTINSNGSFTPTISSGTLTITADDGNIANSVYFSTLQPTDRFDASFVYQATSPGGIGLADGAAFVLQDESLAAVGGPGSGLGYGGIDPSASIQLNVFAGTGESTTGLGIDGAINHPTATTPNVDLTSGDPILVSLAFDGSTLTETLKDESTALTFSTGYSSLDLPTTLGADTAWVGFTGGTGGGEAVQTVKDFSFQGFSGTTPEPGSMALVAAAVATTLLPITRGRVRRRSRPV
jgi:hypothetical protein